MQSSRLPRGARDSRICSKKPGSVAGSACKGRKCAASPGRVGVGDEHCIALVHSVDESAGSQAPVRRLKAVLAPFGVDPAGRGLEAFLLVRCALHSLDGVPHLPVGGSVKRLFCEVFASMTDPAEWEDTWFSAGHSHFQSLCKIASLRRFPAGEFDWEVSGIPRSFILRMPKRDLPRVLYTLAFRMRGFAPTLVSHLGVRRPTRSLSEHENNRSFHRMARALALQPGVRGWSGSSWMRAPETQRVSPRLGWVNRTLLENGGVVTTIGPADPEVGVLRSETRRRLYDAGEFRPTMGFGLWPRREMLAWAAAHPELGED